MIDLFYPPKPPEPKDAKVHRIKDDPDEPLTGKEKRLSYWREWHERNNQKKETDGLEAWYVSQKLKDEYAANDYEGAW